MSHNIIKSEKNNLTKPEHTFMLEKPNVIPGQMEIHQSQEPPTLLDHIREGKVNFLEGDELSINPSQELPYLPLFFNDFLLKDKEGHERLPTLEEEQKLKLTFPNTRKTPATSKCAVAGKDKTR